MLPVPPLPTGRPRLVVTGFMGTGKTSAGEGAAHRLGLPFFDLDQVVEAQAGMPVPAIFDRLGEEAFRAMEREAMAEAAHVSHAVVATGGGAALHKAEWTALTDGALVAVLTARPDEIERRVAATDRPLLRADPASGIRQLLASRASTYAATGIPLPTDGLAPDEVAEELARRYTRGCPPSDAPFELAVGGDVGTRVWIGEDLLGGLGDIVTDVAPGSSRVLVVIDRLLVPSTGERIRDGLARAGLDATVAPIEGGEAAKSVEGLARLWERFRELGLDRNGVVAAVGGGTVLDVAGMAAATFLRGVPTVNVPTTLLAMADAGLGGKVGINHAGVKNLAGAFHQPLAVVVDVDLLHAVPPAMSRNGLAEIAKAAVLASPLVLDALPDPSPDQAPGWGWLLEQAIRIKAAYVAADPSDRGVRASLNLGHTFAHAVEAASGYRVPHGDAVASGLVAAARLGTAAAITPRGLDERLAGILSRIGLPVEVPELAEDALVAAMGADKKRSRDGMVFVVPAAPGAVLLEGVELAVALAAMYPERVRRS